MSSEVPWAVPKAPRLQHAIWLYESLSRHQGNAQGLSYMSPPAPYRRLTKAATSKADASVTKMNSFGSTLRRLSGSWSKTRLAKTMGKRRSTEHQKALARKNTGNEMASTLADGKDRLNGPLGEHSAGADSEPVAHVTSVDAESAFRGPTSAPFSESFPLKRWDERGGGGNTTVLVADGDKTACDNRDYLEPSSRQQQQTWQGDTDEAGSRVLPGGRHDEARCSSRRPSRRRVSRSGTLVTRAQCVLEHPRPVRDRANEVKRLMSLCRDKVATGWKGRVQSE